MINKAREYSTRDLMLAWFRAVDAGPEAVAHFRAELDRAYSQFKNGEPISSAFFRLLEAGNCDGREDA